MKKITLIIFVIALTFSLALAGCSQRNDSAESNGVNEPVEIVFWEMYGPNRKMPEIVDKFNESQSDIHVKVENFPSHTALLQKLQVVSSSGEKPDIILYDVANVAITNEIMDIVDLNKFIDSDPEFNKDDFFSAFLNDANVNGKQVGLHAYANNLMIFYNKKLFKEVGLDPENPPKTWDDIVEYGKKLTKPGQWGYHMYGIDRPYFEHMSWSFQAMVWQNGGDVWNDDFTKPTFNTPEGLETLNWILDLIHKHKITTMTPPEKGFETGRIAMILDGSWQIKAYEDAIGAENLGAAFLPKKDQNATNVGGEVLYMVKSDEKKENAAWEFLKYMTSADVQYTIAEASGNIPTRKSSMESEAMQDLFKNSPATKVAADQMEYGRYRAPIKEYPKISEQLHNYLKDAMFLKLTPEEALNEAQRASEDIMINQN